MQTPGMRQDIEAVSSERNLERQSLMSQLQEWFRRLGKRGAKPLNALYDIAYEYNRVVGPRSVYARVKIAIEPHDSFLFVSRVKWPDGSYDDLVMDGILDALVGWGYKLPVA